MRRTEHNRTPHALIMLLTLLVSATSVAEQVADSVAPESGVTPSIEQNASVSAKQFMVVTAHPLATEAGYQIIQQGGNATDAMVTIQTVLGLVEPQSSGLGGGAFMLYFDNSNQQLTTFDARETSPLNAPNDLFLDKNGDRMQFFEAVLGGRSVGTPGTPKLLWERHQASGQLPWQQVLQPAIKLAREGFSVTPRMANALRMDQKRLSQDPDASALYYPKGVPLQAGDILVNHAYADTLEKLIKHGGDYFYSPDFAKAIIKKVKSHPNPGYLGVSDFQSYRVIERVPVCANYTSYEICGMGPPSSGAIAVAQTLKQLEFSDFGSLKPESPLAWQLVAESSRLAFADRGKYLADSDYIHVPMSLLNDEYLRQRSKLIQSGFAATQVAPGSPPNADLSYLPGNDIGMPSTSHFVIIDRDRNIISMTTTIENGFGSRLMVNGFLLNNELTDFSFSPRNQNGLVANRVQPGKRPRSSMAPTIVFDTNTSGDRAPLLAIGSPGGSRIIPYVTNALIRILNWGQTPQEAFNRPHIVNRFGTLDLEKGLIPSSWQERFQAFGYETNIRDLNSGLHAVMIQGDTLVAGTDPRREGTAMGD